MNNLNWKDLAHYGTAAVSLLLAGATEVGMQFPGVSVDPHVAGAFGIGVLLAGLKGGVKTPPALGSDRGPAPGSDRGVAK